MRACLHLGGLGETTGRRLAFTFSLSRSWTWSPTAAKTPVTYPTLNTSSTNSLLSSCIMGRDLALATTLPFVIIQKEVKHSFSCQLWIYKREWRNYHKPTFCLSFQGFGCTVTTPNWVCVPWRKCVRPKPTFSSTHRETLRTKAKPVTSDPFWVPCQPQRLFVLYILLI